MKNKTEKYDDGIGGGGGGHVENVASRVTLSSLGGKSMRKKNPQLFKQQSSLICSDDREIVCAKGSNDMYVASPTLRRRIKTF